MLVKTLGKLRLSTQVGILVKTVELRVLFYHDAFLLHQITRTWLNGDAHAEYRWTTLCFRGGYKD